MKLSLGLALILGGAIAACSATTDDAGSPDTARDEELNEAKALGMTDVTILYPQPEKWEFVDDMLGPSSEDAKGELLPASVFAKIADLAAPKMIGNDGNLVDPPQAKLFARWAENFAYMRFVGIRLDPCFGETSNLGATNCLSTIRLVGQFLHKQPQNGTSPVFDNAASVHLFYKVSQQDFAALAKEMLALRLSTGLPLQKSLLSPQHQGVHPTLKEQGLRGAYATALKAIILKYAGEQTLSRVAFSVEDRFNAQSGGYYMQPQQNPDTRWVFGGFEYERGALRPLNISSLGDYTGLQTIDSFPRQRGDKNMVTVDPPIAIGDNLLGAFNPVKQPNGSFQFTDIEKGKTAARKLQNPNDYTTKNADCVSCHMAKEALIGRDDMQPNALDFKSYTFRLDSSINQFGPFRMFGWDQGRPVVAQRVVNETANVLEFLNKNVMR
jgi:hypothetical protein